MDPDEDRYLLWRVLRSTGWDSNAQVQAIKIMAVLLRLGDLVLDEQPNFILKAIGGTVARGSDVRGGFGQPDRSTPLESCR